MLMTANELLNKTITVEIADAKVSSDPDRVLATYSLGSCIGVCLYCDSEKTGGMLHFLLPDSSVNPQRARENPFLYADTGMKALLEELAARGISKNEIKVKVAGGAKIIERVSDGFEIGKRNYLALRKFLWKNGMFIDSEDVGGSLPRSLFMIIDNGKVIVRSAGSEKVI